MSAAYPDIYLYAYLGGTWVDISAYQIGSIPGKWGIFGNSPIDFVAGTGTYNFDLNNTGSLFSPGHASVISSDWKKGARIKLVISFENKTRILSGRISGLLPGTSDALEIVTVYVNDWMDAAAKYPINYPDLLTNATSDQAVQAILNDMPIPPLATSLAVGTNTFPFIFDTTTDFTQALSEFSKVCQSELCYLYLRKDGTYGETLVLENADTRQNASHALIPKSNSDSGFLLKEDGGYLLLEDGGKIILDEGETVSRDDDAIDYEVSHGDLIINDVQFRYIPRKLVGNAPYPAGSNNVQCHEYGYPPGGSYSSSIKIAAGETIIISDKYNITGNTGLPFTGLSTDRKITSAGAAAPSLFLFQNSDKTGTNLSANLEIVSLTMRVDHFVLALKNNGATDGYLWIGALFGNSLFTSMNPVSEKMQDSASILENDYQSLSFDQPYQTTPDDGREFSSHVLLYHKDPQTELNRIILNANRSGRDMMAFLTLDIGYLIHASNAAKDVDGNYFIQNIDFKVKPGKIINYSLGVIKQNLIPPDVVVWLDASQLALANNDPVASWTDISGTNNHAIQSTSANKPLFVAANASINNKATVKFDAINDYLALTNILALSEYTYFVVFSKNPSGTTNDCVLTDTDTVYHMLHYGTDWYGPAAAVTSPMTPGTFYIQSAVVSGGIVKRYANNVALDGAGAAAGGSPRFRYIGLPGFICNCEIAEIIITSSAMSDTARNTIYNYLKAKYAL